MEAALKTAAIHTKRPGVIAFEGAYHGLTYGALDTTWRAHFRSPFSEQLGHFTAHVPFGRVPNVANIENFGAVIVEPIQGRGGIVVPPDDFLPKLRKFCDDHGVVLIFDEIYSGFLSHGTVVRLRTLGRDARRGVRRERRWRAGFRFRHVSGART